MHRLEPCPIPEHCLVGFMEGPGAAVVDNKRVVLGPGGQRVVLQHVEQIQVTVRVGVFGLHHRLDQRSDQFRIVKDRPSGVEVGQGGSGGRNGIAQRDIY